MPALTWKRILASLLPASFPEMAVNAVPVLWREWTGKETALGEIPLDKAAQFVECYKDGQHFTEFKG